MKWLLLIGFLAATAASFAVPPAQGFLEPDLARIVFFHLPCAFATTVFVIRGAVCSAGLLFTRQWIWELRAAAAHEMALALACATMATGIVFSRVQWGAWWHWDVRQTSFMVVLLILGAYFAIRLAFEDAQGRAKAAAGYSVLSMLPLLFLIFVFPNLPQVSQASLHPQGVVAKGRFSPDYWSVVLGVFALLLCFTYWLYRLHVRSSMLVETLKESYGNLETDRGGSADAGVVRPVPLR